MKLSEWSRIGVRLFSLLPVLSFGACTEEPETPVDPTPAPAMSANANLPMAPPPPNPPVPVDERIGEVRKRVTPVLSEKLKAAGFALGNPAFIRIFKESRELEVWLKPAGSAIYKKWQTWPVAAMSGNLGPKLRQGDHQAPEGFYNVNAKALNPRSSYHLSFNIGYPNAYDLAQQCTGNLIMVHGNKVSIGCFAMTDPVIEEIYLLVETALIKGQTPIPVHVFPFRMTEARMELAKEDKAELQHFWNIIRKGYDAFETTSIPPKVVVRNEEYVISPVAAK
ncbi:MAG: murein L,D-transpeptidase family protein [Verrucomicrobium sp.]